MLGDLNQAIFTHENSRKLLGELGSMFPEDKTRVVQLTKSYRSTEQITNFTKNLLTNGENIIPFNRQGDLPHIYVNNGMDEAVEQVKSSLISIWLTTRPLRSLAKPSRNVKN